MSEGSNWSPTYIDIETQFSRFIKSYRSGQLVSDLMPKGKDIPLNADYYFPNDQVVVELKTMQTDSRDSYPERLVKAYRHFGFSGSDLMGFLYRGEPMPEAVARRLQQQIANPLRQAIRKANKQIKATKRFFGLDNVFGLAIVANDRNLGISAETAVAILGDSALRLQDCHVDGFVYMTPNVYHDAGDGLAQSLWVPLYSNGKEDLANFVNPLGSAWFDFAELLGDRYLGRVETDRYDFFDLSKLPIQTFDR